MTREEQATVNAIWRFLEEQERRRQEMRKRDDEWRRDVKSDIEHLKQALDTVPCVMDEKIRLCRDSREEVTAQAVSMASTDKAVTGWLEKRIGRLAVAVAVANGIVALVIVLANWLIQ